MPASLENKQIGPLALAIAKPIYACENKHIGLLALTIAKSKYACENKQWPAGYSEANKCM